MPTAPPTTDIAALASRLRLGVTRLARKLRREGDTGITPTLLAALSTIERHGPVTAGMLATHEQVEKPTVTRLLAVLEERELIQRTSDPLDGRVTWVQISPSGRKLLQSTRRRKDGYLAKRIKHLSARRPGDAGAGGRDPRPAGGGGPMTRVGLAVHRTFHSLHTRNFRLYFIGQVVSVTGTWLNATASAWLVLRLSDSGFALGFNTALTFLPILLVGAFGGMLADRYDKRKILILTQAMYATLALTLFALVVTDVAQLWMVYTLSLAAGLVTALDNPTRQSFYMELVPEDDLTNAVSLNSAVFMGARIVGASAAALVITTIGLANCFLIDAVSYVAVIGALLAMRTKDLHGREARDVTRARQRARRVPLRVDHARAPASARPDDDRVHVRVQLGGAAAAAREADVRRRRRHVRRHVGAHGARGVRRRIDHGEPRRARPSAAPDFRRLSIWSIASGAALLLTAVAPTLNLAYVSMIPLGLTVMIVHHQRQLDAAAPVAARVPRTRDGALRHGVPGEHADRRRDHRLARPTPGSACGVRPGRRLRTARGDRRALVEVAESGERHGSARMRSRISSFTA